MASRRCNTASPACSAGNSAPVWAEMPVFQRGELPTVGKIALHGQQPGFARPCKKKTGAGREASMRAFEQGPRAQDVLLSKTSFSARLP
jgi:hypothetical protein